MGKTIEEAAAEYTGEFSAKYNLYNPELLQVIADAYKASADRIMSLPLADRLTEAEVKKIKLLHYEGHLFSDHTDTGSLPAEAFGLFYMGRYNLLDTIFGPDFFKEEK